MVVTLSVEAETLVEVTVAVETGPVVVVVLAYRHLSFAHGGRDGASLEVRGCRCLCLARSGCDCIRKINLRGIG